MYSLNQQDPNLQLMLGSQWVEMVFHSLYDGIRPGALYRHTRQAPHHSVMEPHPLQSAMGNIRPKKAS